MEELFDINHFSIIDDEKNYYFFRALNIADNSDIDNHITTNSDGQIERVRTDRERYGKNAKYSVDSPISLEQVFDHIKMHNRKDTNCISLSSNANVSALYGRGSYRDKYVIVKVSKKEIGEKVINAGQYMLAEIQKKIDEYVQTLNDEEILKSLEDIDKSTTSEELQEAIKTTYTSETHLALKPHKMHNGIKYKSPVARISSYQALDEKQTLEKNRIIAKLTLLERKTQMPPLMPQTANNGLLVQTVGNAFSSLELLHYGDINQEEIIDVPKEIIDIFSLIQQEENQNNEKKSNNINNKNRKDNENSNNNGNGNSENNEDSDNNDNNETIIKDLEREVIKVIENGAESPSLQDRESKVREDIDIDEMYELTNGQVPYGTANSIVKNMFYLSKGQANARKLAEILKQITKDNEKYRSLIEDISKNTFRIEPEIITRKSNEGVKISESVSLNLKDDEVELIDKIKGLSDEEQQEIIQNGGLSNVRNIMSDTFAKSKRESEISKEEYYAEAIFSLYDWKKIGIEEFTPEEKNNLLKKIQESNPVEIYKSLEQQGIDKSSLPTATLNAIMGKGGNLEEDLSIERIERFLGYYDVINTEIQLRPYQQRAVEKTDEIFEDNRFASVILPTGGGKSFVAMTELMKHKDEDILYLAPQNEILEQMKDYIIKYIHGPVNTLGRSKDEIVADVFPNLKFSTYPRLLAQEGKEITKKKYGFIVLDELHRTGADKWGQKLDELLENQADNVKTLGITATPRRDSDGINMATEIAQKLGYTNRGAVSGKHVAINMSLVNAIRMGLVVNPKLVSCVYNLKQDGTLDELKEKIDQIQDIEEKNEKLEQYEKLIRDIENADGVSKILQDNVKKGGKYIVFLPAVDQLEDEDGNVIGRKSGIDKISEYEKQIMEYFKDSDIKPKIHSMLGAYGDKENAKRLEEFQNNNSGETDFMLVINKANEGLHLNKLDGIIWLRPLDENSRILYLQQLGRAIYSEDPDNPTKDEDRPVVIDLVNNTLKVNWDNEITEKDDIEMLNLIVDWAEKHDDILPDINSSDKEEKGYASVLKGIQNKYKAYLQSDFKDLNDKQIDEIKEIIEIGSKINLWQIELPEKVESTGAGKNGKAKNEKLGPFEISGVIGNFVELNKEIGEDIEQDTIDRFINLLQKLSSIGVDVTRITQLDTIESLAKKSDISADILDKNGIDKGNKIGSKLNSIRQAKRGKGNTKPPTEEQVEEIKELGISLDERDTTQEFIDKLKELSSIGVDVTRITTGDTIESLAKKSDISADILDKNGIDKGNKIGNKLTRIRQANGGKGSYKPPTEEQVEEIVKELGISLEPQKRTSKEIAKASISSIKDMDMLNTEEQALKTLMEKEKKQEQQGGEKKLDEQ